MEKLFSALVTFFSQVDRLGLTDWVLDQPLLIEALLRRPIEKFPGPRHAGEPVSLANPQEQKGEHRFIDPIGVDRCFRAHAYAQPNVMVGYTQAVKIAGMAEAFNIGIESGGAGPLQNLHLHAGVANGGHCEWHLQWMALNRKIYKNMPEPKAGVLAAPNGPGLGFDADPAAIKQYSRDTSSEG